MKKLFIVACCSFLTLTFSIVNAQTNRSQQLRVWHKNLTCQNCHSAFPQMLAPTKVDCLACHQSEVKVAQRTEHLSQNGVNPHDNYHYGMSMDCVSCHREHSKSYESCNECHNFSQWLKPTP